MSTFPLFWPLLAVLVSSVGLVGIAWCRCARAPGQASWGRRLFLLTLLGLGISALVLAWDPQRGVLYLGLAVAALVVVMLWDGPRLHNEQRG